MTSQTRRLLYTAGLTVLIALTIWSWIPKTEKVTAEGPLSPVLAHETGTDPVTTTNSGPGAGAQASPAAPLAAPDERRSYAIGLHELDGLPQDTVPGTMIDLWAAWDPPITPEPRFQRLMRSVIVEDIQSPVVPEGPVTVILSVPTHRIPDLLYADRYGAISVTLPVR
jgi:hypothetical protein